MSKKNCTFARQNACRQKITTIMTKQDILNLIGQPEELTVEYNSAKGGIP